jgi:ABC-2 type transport system permease protein
MRFRAGSLAWLIVHDLTLHWRRFMEMFQRLPPAATLPMLVGGAVLLHLIAWPVAQWLVPLVQGGGVLSASTIALAASSVLAWIIAQGLLGLSRTLRERASNDLLFASPIPARLLLASRATTTAASSFGSVGLLVLPVANMGALLNGPVWLATYPALFALALLGTAIGLAAAIGLFLAFDAGRARAYAQVCAALAGGAFLLTAQIAALLPNGLRTAILVRGSSPRGAALIDMELLGWLCLAGVGVFIGAVLLLSESYLRASLRAVGGSSSANVVPPGQGSLAAFGSSIATTLRRKEWRLLRRDHAIFAQLALQIIYTVPLVAVLLRGVDNIPMAIAIAPAIVVIGAQISASLAWITVSGEDAPELIAAAPVSRQCVQFAKVTAIGAPVCMVLALPLAGLALLAPFVALIVMLCAAAASISTALINLWHPMPGNRRGMLRRHSQAKIMALVEHLMAMLWAIATVLAVTGSAWALVPIALANVVLLLLSPPRRKLQRAPAR